MAYTDPPTEVVAAGAMEVWQIFNTTADTHPMHFHLVNAQVLSRQPFKLAGGVPTPIRRGARARTRTNWAGRKPSRCTRAKSPAS